MTEASYQQAKVLMRQLVYMRGKISQAKKSFLKLAENENKYNATGDTDLAEKARQNKDRAADRLQFYKTMFALTVFPLADLPTKPGQQYCRICQTPISVIDNVEYCTDCQDNQNIPKYDYKDRNNKEVS